jgi:putative endonuclease
MPCAYILYSKTLNRFYAGACNGPLDVRIRNHNNKKYGLRKYTSRATDWMLYLKFEALDFGHAVRMERRIKSMKSRKYIENLNRYSELRYRLINQTKGT